MSNRKVFISVLGTGNYGRCRYSSDEYISPECNYVQEATLDCIVAKEWTESDAVYILVTDNAYNMNWLDNGHTDKDSHQPIRSEGLESRLNSMQLPCNIKAVSIKDGKTEDEILSNFTIIFELLQDKDELYFDLTHGFRYLPMLVLVLGNYSKLLKGTIVKHISYGNYEMRNMQTQIAPFVNLSVLSSLQDWTTAAASYLNEGNADGITSLCKSSLSNIVKETKGQNIEAKSLNTFAKYLSEVIEERRTCRGIDIINGNSIGQVKDKLSILKRNILPAFTPIIEEIKKSISPYNSQECVMNGYRAAKWCYDNGLYQQSCTIFQENIISDLCMRFKKEWKNRTYRDMIEDSLYIVYKQLDVKDWNLTCIRKEDDEETKNNKMLNVSEIIQDQLIQEIAKIYRSFKDLRNDFNHAGMNDNSSCPLKLKYKIKEQMSELLVSLGYVD